MYLQSAGLSIFLDILLQQNALPIGKGPFKKFWAYYITVRSLEKKRSSSETPSFPYTKMHRALSSADTGCSMCVLQVKNRFGLVCWLPLELFGKILLEIPCCTLVCYPISRGASEGGVGGAVMRTDRTDLEEFAWRNSLRAQYSNVVCIELGLARLL